MSCLTKLRTQERACIRCQIQVGSIRLMQLAFTLQANPFAAVLPKRESRATLKTSVDPVSNCDLSFIKDLYQVRHTMISRTLGAYLTRRFADKPRIWQIQHCDQQKHLNNDQLLSSGSCRQINSVERISTAHAFRSD